MCVGGLEGTEQHMAWKIEQYRSLVCYLAFHPGTWQRSAEKSHGALLRQVSIIVHVFWVRKSTLRGARLEVKPSGLWAFLPAIIVAMGQGNICAAAALW